MPVTQAAQLSGKVMVYGYEKNVNGTTMSKEPSGTNEAHYVTGKSSGYNENAKLIEDHGLRNTIVELRNTSEIRRTLTDSRGHFEFEQLRPAEWTLKINSGNLPEYHYLEKDTFKVNLKSGERKEISAKVLPRKRRIRIIDEPQILLEEEQR